MATMTSTMKRWRDRRGVALPVALVGLVAVSLLVTTALLTSSAESAISTAQANGARALYNAEGGLNEYLRQTAVAAVGLTPGQQTVTLAESGQRVRVTVARLRRTVQAQATTSTYSLTAEPVNAQGAVRGRAVVAMVQEFIPPPVPLDMNITSAITLGGDLDVNGNAFTVNGRFNGCGVTAGVDAVRSASDSNIETNNERHMDNFQGVNDLGANTQGRAAIDRSNLTREQLADNVLAGRSLEEIIALIPLSKKWGPRWHASGTANYTWDGRLDTGEDLAVVDANGGTIEVLGGTGVLIVVNGNMRMRGNSTFTGVIIVEGNFSLSGNPQINGALVSLAMQGENEIVQDESAIANGNITVQYDKCAIDAAQQAFGRASGPQTPRLMGRTFAWLEVVR
jgi:hypothetical protein